MFVNQTRRALMSGAAAIASIGAAHAQTTPAGTTVSNQAQATYTVNGAAQTANSTIASFVVDRKANFTVERVQTGPTTVNLNEAGVVTTFRVTNLTNGIQDFILDPDQPLFSLGNLLAGTDDFNLNNLKAYVDNGDGQFVMADDTATFIDQLPADGSRLVFIVGDVPNDANADLAFVSLHVTIANGDAAGPTPGAPLVATVLDLINQQDVVDVVFADDDSDGELVLGDIARNGQGRAYAAYVVGTREPNLTITKSSRIMSDGMVDGLPKALPGAVVEYCFVITNTTAAPASTINLRDVIPTNTTYVLNTIQVGGLPVLGTCLTGGVAQTDAGGDTSPGNYSGAFDGGTNTVTMGIPTLLGGTSVAASFQVKIN